MNDIERIKKLAGIEDNPEPMINGNIYYDTSYKITYSIKYVDDKAFMMRIEFRKTSGTKLYTILLNFDNGDGYLTTSNKSYSVRISDYFAKDDIPELKDNKGFRENIIEEIINNINLKLRIA